MLALWLTRLGIRVRIIDKTSEPGTTSRALAVQARTLELYRQIGLADAVVSRGRKMTTINLWKAGHQVAHVVFGEMGWNLSTLPRCDSQGISDDAELAPISAKFRITPAGKRN